VRKLPLIGTSYIYSSLAGMAYFRVVEVNPDTGCIYLVAECSHEKALEILNVRVRDKHGEWVNTTEFAWIEKDKRWAVNVEWDSWVKNIFGPVQEEPCDTLSRFTQALGGYDKEIGVK
jgi:hypothetical protein